MTQETKSALLIGFIFIMIVLVVVVDGFDTGRTPAPNDDSTNEMFVVPPAEDDSFQRSQPPALGQIQTAPAQVERYEVKRGDTLSGICAEYYGDAGLFPDLQEAKKNCKAQISESLAFFGGRWPYWGFIPSDLHLCQISTVSPKNSFDGAE